MKILVVDDNEDARTLIETILKSQGHTIEKADNGQKALDIATSRRPDLIISDIMMPEMDGFELCRRVKANKELHTIPLIFYTATFADEKDEQLAMALGASRFIIKPMRRERFIAIINDVLEECSVTGLPVQESPGKNDKELSLMYEDSLAKKLQKKVRDLHESKKQLRELNIRLAETEETERKRLSKKLHDLVGQNLSALNINLNIIQGSLPADCKEKLAPRLADSMALVEETTEHIRDVMADLHPHILDDYGLFSALRWYGEIFFERTGISIELQGEEMTPRLPQNMETAFFRIAQEAMTNTAKYAEANLVIMALEKTNGIAKMTISDDGTGFDPGGLRQSGRQELGLSIMRERAEALGGRFKIESGPGKGTRVMVEVQI